MNIIKYHIIVHYKHNLSVINRIISLNVNYIKYYIIMYYK